MKKFLVTLLLLVSFPLSVYAVHVNGYYRSNGTYVNSYERTAPDGNPYNNYSYPGNYNPNTGSITGGSADTYLNNYYNNSSGGYSGSSYSPSYVPSIPTCSGMATYDSLSSSCKCMSGYVIDSNGDCTSGSIVCHQKYGYNSSYSYSDKTCSCDYGYKFDSTGQCVSQNSYCTTNYGYGSEYSTLKSRCVCRTGYTVNTITNTCVYNTSSSSYLPTSSYTLPTTTTTCPANSYTSNGNCYCSTGYMINSDKSACIPISVKTNDQICQDSFGINVSWDGTKATSGGLNCNCKTGFAWKDKNKTSCTVIGVKNTMPSLSKDSIYDEDTKIDKTGQVVTITQSPNYKLSQVVRATRLGISGFFYKNINTFYTETDLDEMAKKTQIEVDRMNIKR